ncbi:unnamed protein product [Chondrus crispus]|uniref:Secreted protein n=1 Tax=Chondrus crispus TaxID=2769 RepID=R7Q4H2_CHOCR|nr:unnamed protein product [Chondrus crispus]CDF32909.1 unnamed protein product [Chondrus crispus]|eukprot:XP_005712710.1 unnamed protein product [Chondrus crispus]
MCLFRLQFCLLVSLRAVSTLDDTIPRTLTQLRATHRKDVPATFLRRGASRRRVTRNNFKYIQISPGTSSLTTYTVGTTPPVLAGTSPFAQWLFTHSQSHYSKSS